jgi:hypothetical protein
MYQNPSDDQFLSGKSIPVLKFSMYRKNHDLFSICMCTENREYL